MLKDSDANKLKFTNTYDASGVIRFEIEKNLEGKTKPWPSFEFELRGDKIGSTPMTASSTDVSGNVTFNPISFTLDDLKNGTNYADSKDFNFTITEDGKGTTSNGITYSDQEFNITVTMTDQKDGKIKPTNVTVKVNGQTSTANIYHSDSTGIYTIVPDDKFINKYNASGSITLGGNKKVEGTPDNPKSRNYSFTLRYQNEQDAIATGSVTVTDGQQQSFSLPIINYSMDENKQLYYTVESETNKIAIGNKAVYDSTQAKPTWTIAYSLTEDMSSDDAVNVTAVTGTKYITVTIVDEGNGTLTCSQSPTSENNIFTNRLSQIGSIVFSASKSFDRWDIADSFELKMEADYIDLHSDIIVSEETPTAVFDKINFFQNDINQRRKFTFTEIKPQDTVSGMTYDSSQYEIFITPFLNSDGGMELKVEGTTNALTKDDNGIYHLYVGEFTNSYNATGKLNLKSSKKIENNDENTDEKHLLPFVLYHKYNGKSEYPDGEPVIEQIVEVQDGTTTDFPYPISYAIEAVPDSEQPSGEKLEILNQLVEENYAEVTTGTDGKRTWTVGYFLTELPAIDQQLKPPTQSFDILVTITDSGTGELEVTEVQVQALNEKGEVVNPFAKVDENQGFAIGPFVNTERKDSSIDGLVLGGKILEGRDLTAADDGKWSVTISAADGNAPLPEVKTVPIRVSEENGSFTGSFAFGSITFKPEHLGTCTPDALKGYVCASKDYHYTLSESGSVAGVTNGDDLSFIIRVSEDENGDVKAEFVDADGNVLTADQILPSLTFTNRTEEIKVTPTGPTFYRLPETGFSALRPTVLNEQPKDLSYRPLAWTLEIPSLALITDIVEVPSMGGEYPVAWLGSSAGLLEGYGLPGEGQAILTGHNHLNTMEAGPFALLKEMGIGDRIFVLDPEEELQIFTVYANEKIAETDMHGLERIAGRFADSLTLITCEDERPEGGYANRRIIAAAPMGKQK